MVIPELGVAPLELPTPDGSPSTDASEPVRSPTPPGVDLELVRALIELGILPSMVTPIVDPVVGTSATAALYPMPPIPVLSGVDSAPGLVASPIRPVGGSPVRYLSLSCQVLPPGSVSDVARSTSGLAQMDQYLQRSASLSLGESTDSPSLPAPLTPRRIIKELVAGSVVGSPTGELTVAVAQLSMPDLSRQGPFDIHQDYSASGASPRVLGSMRGCQYRMNSYEEGNGCPDFNPAYGIHLHDPRLLEYVGAPESARLLSRGPEYWLHHMGRDKTLSAALQLQHDASLLLSNIQVLQQFVTSLNRMSSEVMRVAFDREPFPSDAVQNVAPAHRVRRAAHYMADMALWRPPSTQGIHGPLPSSSCNACMSCTECFPDLPQ